jgi:transcriptional regulator with XRE-family HTH domain
MSIEALAETNRESELTVSRYELGMEQVAPDAWSKIAEALDMPPSRLFPRANTVSNDLLRGC